MRKLLASLAASLAVGVAAAGAEADVAPASWAFGVGVCAKPVTPAVSTLRPSARETSSFFIL